MPGCQEESLRPTTTQLARRSYSHQLLGARRRRRPARRAHDGLAGVLRRPGAQDRTRQVAGADAAAVHAPRGRPALSRREDHRPFTLDPVKPDDTVVFLAHGHRRGAAQLHAVGPAPPRPPGPILSACCVRYSRTWLTGPSTSELMRRHPQLHVPEPDHAGGRRRGHKVYIQDLITSGQLEERLGRALDPARTHVFLCGNPKMIGVPEKDRETGRCVYPQPPGVIEIAGETRASRRTSPTSSSRATSTTRNTGEQ